MSAKGLKCLSKQELCDYIMNLQEDTPLYKAALLELGRRANLPMQRRAWLAIIFAIFLEIFMSYFFG